LLRIFTHKKSTMRKKYLLPILVLVLCSHDLYIKMDTYFLSPKQEAILSLYNGTFEKSENIITRDRIIDASIVADAKRTSINPDQWIDQDSTITQLPFKTGKSGTYVVGVSTKARNIELTAKKFNDYLKHDGVLDMLELRKKNNKLDQDAVESYQKHVKAIYQVGDKRTTDWSTPLGYPIEFIPHENPYEKYTGDQLLVQLLLDGEPLKNQLVYTHHIHAKVDSHHHHEHSHDEDAQKHRHEDDHGKDSQNKESHSHSHDNENEHSHTHGQELRTDDQGMISVDLPSDGIYYLRTIHMTEVTNNKELTHESKWATLSFQVTHSHEHDHSHNHDHDHEEEIPMWMFVVGSVFVIIVLFFVFRKKE